MLSLRAAKGPPYHRNATQYNHTCSYALGSDDECTRCSRHSHSARDADGTGIASCQACESEPGCGACVFSPANPRPVSGSWKPPTVTCNRGDQHGPFTTGTFTPAQQMSCLPSLPLQKPQPGQHTFWMHSSFDPDVSQCGVGVVHDVCQAYTTCGECSAHQDSTQNTLNPDGSTQFSDGAACVWCNDSVPILMSELQSPCMAMNRCNRSNWAYFPNAAVRSNPEALHKYDLALQVQMLPLQHAARGHHARTN